MRGSKARLVTTAIVAASRFPFPRLYRSPGTPIGKSIDYLDFATIELPGPAYRLKNQVQHRYVHCGGVAMSKSYQHLSRDERAAIAIGLEQGLSRRAIARRLNRSPSTISREVRRNGGKRVYHPARARQRREARPVRPGRQAE